MPNDQDTTLDIGTPAGRFVQEFPKTTKVGDVITAAIEAMNLDPNEQFDLVHEGAVLDRNRPIVSYQFDDGTRLELVATGSGV